MKKDQNITLEEVLELVEFERDDKGVLHVSHIHCDVGYVEGDVDNVGGYVWGSQGLANEIRDITSHTGIVSDIERLTGIYMGNPRYSFWIDGYRVVTQGCEIWKYENKQVAVTVGTVHNRLTLKSIEEVALEAMCGGSQGVTK
jgi:hypothetical protein